MQGVIIINRIAIWVVLFVLVPASAGAGGFMPAADPGLNYFTGDSDFGFLLTKDLAVNITNDSLMINATGNEPFELVYLNDKGQVTDHATALTIVTGGENITAQLGDCLYQSRNPVLDTAFVKNAAGGFKREIILARPGLRIRQNAEYWTFFDGNDTKAWLIAYRNDSGQVIWFIGPSLASINPFTDATYTYERQ